MIKRRIPPRKLPREKVVQPAVNDIKNSVSALAGIGRQSVKTVRDAFAAGVAPYQTAGSGSVSSYVSSLTEDRLGSSIVKSTARMGLKTSTAGSSILPPKPELDSADIIEAPGGILDQFSVKLTMSLPSSQISKISFIKIFRSKLGPVKAQRPAFAAISLAPGSSGIGLDSTTSAAFRAGEIGVGNKLTSFIFDDKNSKTRSVSSPDSRILNEVLPPANTNRGESNASLLEISGADRSVVENLKFYLNRRSIDDLKKPTIQSIDAGNRVGVNILKGSSVASSTSGIVQETDSLNFSEIAKLDITAGRSRSVGDFREVEFVDKSVVYGAGFAYYAVCVDANGSEGPRSRMVNVSVIRNVPPAQPNVSYSVIAGHPRFTIRCKPGESHVEIYRAGRAVLQSVKLGSENSLIEQGPATKIGQFWHLTDASLGPDGTTTFVDTNVIDGDSITYRIYSVDPYGLKSQTPFSCLIKLPERGQQIPIPVPSITVEQAAGQPAMSIKMSVDDVRVAGFVVQRRDVSISEKSVHQANQPEFVDIGTNVNVKRAGSRRGPTMLDADWPTFIPASGGSASFIDTSVRLDRMYQYAVGAVDKRGNKTLLVGSQPVGIYSKVVIDPPTAFGAKVIFANNEPKGVMLSWEGGTNDFSPNALVGDQDVLFATSVRSVYQIERRELGIPFWDAMPATTESYFFDKASTEPNPAFRPAYVRPGSEYEYRVLAMQSGGFVSSRTDAISVPVIPRPPNVEFVWVRTTPLNSNPLSVIVSWNMKSDFIERWEVEKASTNRFFGEQITSMDSNLARSLSYSRVADISPESSRAKGLNSAAIPQDKSVYVGNRFYIDSDVYRANSYFYRVRSVGRLNIKSEWTYAGIVIKDSAFDKKFFSVLSDDAKISYSSDPRPILKKKGGV